MIARRAIGQDRQFPRRTTSLLRAKANIKRQIHLPEEVLVCVISLLRLQDILRCRLLNRRIFNIIKNSLALQFRIELAHAALEELWQPIEYKVDIRTTIQRLDSLRKLQFGWRNLAWRARHVVSLDHPRGALYELNSGIFVTGKRRKLGIARTQELVLQELPSLGCPYPPSKADLNCHVAISQVCISIQQDLLILLEESRSNQGGLVRNNKLIFKLHLRSLSSNLPHPAAANPVLEYDCKSQWMSYSFVMQIMGNSLGVLFTSGVLGDSDYERFVVWDWTTSVKRGMVSMPGSRYDSFTFISEDTFVIPCGRTETINVFLFRPTPPSVFPDRGPAIHHLCALKLPALNPMNGYKYLTISCQSQPSPETQTCHYSPNPIPRPKKLFVPDQHDGIVQFTATLASGTRTTDLIIVTHRRALMSFVVAGQDDLGDPLADPWESYPMMPAKTWGPDITFPFWRAISRCMISPFTYIENSQWRSQVYGHRMVQLVHSNTPRSGQLRVLDFNPLFVNRPPLFPEDYHPIIQSTVVRRMITEVGIIPKGEIWVDDIQSGLPYYEVTTKDAFPLAGVMMDEERIIGLKTGTPGSRDIIALDVFVI
ncbi:hypothetical protein FRC14_003522 [Serendipita sp. 396]|nr:hypothetical protein FRC14_003522 [Serendipita sp. 396]KAG8780761.1 hypothetical protein FRC15_009282 [Serendipita sp. 397]